MTALAPVALELLKGKNNKEQVDLILEPLQVMINLAVLGFCPIGTKINIHENMLYLHQPTFAQGLWHAIRRYYKWYKNEDNEIYNYILELAKEGIKNLIKTYQKADKKSILHTLSLYNNILDLDTPDLFKTDSDDTESITIDKVFKNITSLYDQKILIIIFSLFKLMKEEDNEIYINNYINGLNKVLKPTNHKIRNWIQTNLTL